MHIHTPAELPTRTPPGNYHGFTIRRRSDGTLLKVPDFAVVRAYGAAENIKPLKRPKHIQLDCGDASTDACAKGWPWVEPYHVRVLSCKVPGSIVKYGWYVSFRCKEDPKGRVLHRMPWNCVRRLTEWMEREPGFETSSLLTMYPDAFYTMCSGQGFEKLDFHGMLTKKCMLTTLGYVGSLMKVTKEPAQFSGKRLRNGSLIGPERVLNTKKKTREDCSICLEDRVVSRQCCLNVCASCHDAVRGLCPICDRNIMNSKFDCPCCGKEVRLQECAYPCISCSTSALCSACYTEYGSCDCES